MIDQFASPSSLNRGERWNRYSKMNFDTYGSQSRGVLYNNLTTFGWCWPHGKSVKKIENWGEEAANAKVKDVG